MRVSFGLEAYDLTDIGIHRVGAREAYLCEYVFRVTRDRDERCILPGVVPNIRKLHDDGLCVTGKVYWHWQCSPQPAKLGGSAHCRRGFWNDSSRGTNKKDTGASNLPAGDARSGWEMHSVLT